MTQAQLADAAAISVSLLRKIEQGARPVTPPVWSSISRALGLADADSVDDVVPASGAVGEAIPSIRCALDCYDLPEDGPVAPIAELRVATDLATAHRLDARYADVAGIVPRLITELTRAAHACRGRDQELAFGLLALAYRAADALCDKFGYADLSARTIELIRWAAGRSGDSVLVGVAAYVRAETFFSSQRPGTGLRPLDAACKTLITDGSRDALATYGSLHMRAAVLAAHAGEPEFVAAHLEEARDVARHVPDGVYYGTAFGPSSVRIHEVAAAAELGDTGAVLGQAAGWQPLLAVPAERRSHYYIELARAQLWAGQQDAALASLCAARRIAPLHTRHSPRVRETARTLIRLQRHPTGALIDFARWTGLAA